MVSPVYAQPNSMQQLSGPELSYVALLNSFFHLVTINGLGLDVREIVSKIYFIGLYAADKDNVQIAKLAKAKLQECSSSPTTLISPAPVMKTTKELVSEIYQHASDLPPYLIFLRVNLSANA